MLQCGAVESAMSTVCFVIQPSIIARPFSPPDDRLSSTPIEKKATRLPNRACPVPQCHGASPQSRHGRRRLHLRLHLLSYARPARVTHSDVDVYMLRTWSLVPREGAPHAQRQDIISAAGAMLDRSAA
jgi:hypothetical protein